MSDASTETPPGSPTTKPPPSREIINLSDSEDEDLKLAIALSLQQPPASPPPPQKPNGLQSLNRAEMERQRLARLNPSAARLKRSASPLESTPKYSKPSNPDFIPPFSKTHLIACTKLSSTRQEKLPQISLSDIIHPSGVHSRENSTPYQLTRCIISSFDWDQEFNYILSRLPLLSNPLSTESSQAAFQACLLLIHEPDVHHWSSIRRIHQQAHQSINIASPPLKPNPTAPYPGVFHPKMGLLSFTNSSTQTFIRIFITTANCNSRDWEMVDNLVFVQDFLPGVTTTDLGKDFLSQLQIFFSAMNCIPQATISSLSNYNFSNINVHLVSSVPGKHSFQQHGIGRICQIIQQLNQQTSLPTPSSPATESIKLECQTSSLGKLEYPYLQNFYATCSGNPIDPIYAQQPHSTNLPIQIIYPSLTTTRNVGLRRPGIEALFLQSQYWTSPRFAQSYFKDSISKQSVHSHTKTIYCQGPKGSWIYLGSHNLTKAAWGYQLKGKRNQWPVQISNWELGIVYSIDDEKVDDVLRYKRPAPSYDSFGPFMRDSFVD